MQKQAQNYTARPQPGKNIGQYKYSISKDIIEQNANNIVDLQVTGLQMIYGFFYTF